MSDLGVLAVEKAFNGVPVLRRLDLDVPNGSLVAVLGPSGCGKTTLLRIIAGFERPDTGIVRLGGKVVAGPDVAIPPERRRVGVVPQEGALFPHLSVADNVAFGLHRDERRSRRLMEVLELVGLAGLERRMPHELSGGQQQRVALARALAPRPAIVLLDEPFTALDTGLRAAVRADVQAALRATAATAVLVTHDQQEALSMADLVAVMIDGRIAQVAPPEELYRGPADLRVATFVGEAIVLDAVAGGATAECALGKVTLRHPAPPGGKGRVVVRPEQVVVSPQGDVPAQVLSTTYYGHDALIRLAVELGGSHTEVAARRHGNAEAIPARTAVRLHVEGPVSFFSDP